MGRSETSYRCIKQILGKVKLDITIFSARQSIYNLARRKNSDHPTLPHLIFVLSSPVKVVVTIVSFCLHFEVKFDHVGTCRGDVKLLCVELCPLCLLMTFNSTSQHTFNKGTKLKYFHRCIIKTFSWDIDETRFALFRFISARYQVCLGGYHLLSYTYYQAAYLDKSRYSIPQRRISLSDITWIQIECKTSVILSLNGFSRALKFTQLPI